MRESRQCLLCNRAGPVWEFSRARWSCRENFRICNSCFRSNRIMSLPFAWPVPRAERVMMDEMACILEAIKKETIHNVRLTQ